MRTLFKLFLLGALAVSAGGVSGAQAAELKIGLAADVSSLDPHYLNVASNVAFSSHIFDALVNVDADGKLIPGLATSWRAVDATHWIFKLRRGVKFHDGSDFSAEDVIFSLDRPATVRNSPGPFTNYTKQIVAKKIIDPYTVELTTATPYGPLALDVSTIFIVSKKAALHASSDDFNSGKALIGTGPYKFVSFSRGDRIVVARNDDYWGGKSDWDKVTFRIITNAASRLAALLAGDVDVIEGVPTADVARLKSDPKFRVEQKISWRTIFWELDQREQAPADVTDLSGPPLPHNPLRDVRVRKAISMAINRQALVDHTMEGVAVPASNIVAPGALGYNAALKVEPYDPAGAKKLLAQAGYPHGFALTLHGTNNRYLNDAQVVQTVAQFLNHVGIKASVQTLPLSVYFSQARSGKFGVALLGWGTLAGDFALRALVGTTNKATGWGPWNWGHYSNPEVDKLVASALASVDQDARAEFAKKAAAVALQDYAVIPLYHQYATWAMRKGLKYTARTDEFTFAHQFHPE
jgi:peptide/nickel transport system substrate-binding protein